MGKTSRWLRALLGGGGGSGKKESSKSSSSSSKPTKEKKRWSFVRSLRDKDRPEQQPPPPPQPPPASLRQTKGSYRETPSSSSTTTYNFEGNDPNKHAIAVAAATAAVAEAAVAAAQAAAAVVKLTSSGRCTTAYVRREDYAAVLIQSAFRGYLAKRALKALKGLVKLQALVRGHIIRKNTAEQMRCLQAVVRVQSRARAGRVHISETQYLSAKPSISHHPDPATPEKYERTYRSNSTSSTRHDRSNSTGSTRNDRSSPLKRNSSKANNKDGFHWDKTQLGRNCLDGRRMDERSWDYYRETQIKYGPTDDEKSDKILEIDPGKPHLGAKHRNISPSSQHPVVLDRSSYMDSPSKDSTTAHLSSSSISSGEVQSRNPQRLPPVGDDEAFCTAENSPQFYSASSIAGSSRRGPFTPTKSDCSRSFLSAYSDHPNYMANTESSRAKVRSQSAPKQRLEFEKSNSGRRYNVHAFHGFGDVRLPTAQRVSAIQASFTSKAYPGSGRLDRLGMPIQREPVGYSGVDRYRF